MSEAEQQLRLVLRKYAADSEELLDGVLEEQGTIRLMAKAETIRVKRSQSALREAVGPFVPWLRRMAAREVPDEWCMDLSETAGPTFGDARALLAAHDGAQVAQRCTIMPDDCASPERCVKAGACQSQAAPFLQCHRCGTPLRPEERCSSAPCQRVAPTLTLEEVRLAAEEEADIAERRSAGHEHDGEPELAAAAQAYANGARAVWARLAQMRAGRGV